MLDCNIAAVLNQVQIDIIDIIDVIYQYSCVLESLNSHIYTFAVSMFLLIFLLIFLFTFTLTFTVGSKYLNNPCWCLSLVPIPSLSVFFLILNFKFLIFNLILLYI